MGARRWEKGGGEVSELRLTGYYVADRGWHCISTDLYPALHASSHISSSHHLTCTTTSSQ